MTVSAPEPVTTPAATGIGAYGATGTSTGAANGADKEMFLQLLVAQLRYQDPSNPADSSQFLSQSAQFTALEKMQDVADRTSALLGAQLAFGASSLVGRDITYTLADGTSGAGTVGGVTFAAEGPLLDVDGVSVPVGLVQSVGATSTPSQT